MHCYQCLIIKQVLKVTKGLIIYFPEAPRCMASVILVLGSIVWEGTSHLCHRHGVQGNPITDHCKKTRMRATTQVAERASELHDHLSCLHRTNVHIPVEDISQVEGGESSLR